MGIMSSKVAEGLFVINMMFDYVCSFSYKSHYFVHSPGDHLLLLMLPDPLESRFVVSDDVGFDSTPAWAITSFNAFSSSSIFDPMSSIRPTIVSLSLLNRVC